jgi:hypothetical protein
LLEETHCIAFGPEGLLRFADTLGFAAEDLLCFPAKGDISEIKNKGAPFSVVCNILKLGCVPSLSVLLRGAGYNISDESVAMVWVRADPTNEKTLGGSCSVPILTRDTCSSEGSRHYLSGKVRSRMAMLCNEVCPRDEAGIMLVDRSLGADRRPPWCIAKIMHELGRDFEVSELRGVQDKIVTYISRNAALFRRLQNMTEEEWLSMSEDSRDKKRRMLVDFEDAAERWKHSPYGYFWLHEGMRRQPTQDEIELCAQRKMVEESAPFPPAR